MSKPFLYAVMCPDGSPYFEEGCVCEDRKVLQDEVVDPLNDDRLPGEPQFKVVALYLRKKARKRS